MAELTIDLLLEDARFKKELDQAAKRASRKGKEVGDNFTSPIKTSLGQIGKIASGFAVGSLLLELPGQITRAFSASIAAANQQEDAINQLNSALRRTGEFTKQASEEFQAFASALQSQSTVGDEVILQQLAYAKSLGLSNHQAKEFVQAALNASAALGKDFGGTLQQLLKTLSGLQGEIGESVTSIRSLSAEQLKAGEAAKLLNSQFAGAARAQLDTYGGAVESLGNSFGDFLESLGQYVTQSKDVNSATQSLTRFFSNLALTIKPNKTVSDQVTLLESKILDLSESIGKSREALAKGRFIDAFALKKNISDSQAEIDNLQSKIRELRGVSQDTANFFGPIQEQVKKAFILPQKDVDDQIAKIKTLGLTQLEQIRLQEQEQVKALEKARSFNDNRILGEQEFQDRLAEVNRQAREQERAIFEQQRLKEAEIEQKRREDLLNAQFSFESFGNAATDVFAEIASAAKVTNKIVGEAIVNGIGGSVAAGFSAFGAALVNGENALEAFGKAFLQQIGQQAVALGTKFILEGAAISFSPTSGGPAVGVPLIAKGTALATFGGALSAFGGGGAGGGGASGSANPQSLDFQPDRDLSTDSVTQERLEPETRVQVTIQGDVLDSDESSLRIVEILQKAKFDNNVVVSGGLA